MEEVHDRTHKVKGSIQFKKDADKSDCYVNPIVSKSVNTIREEVLKDKENRHIVTKYLATEDAHNGGPG